MEGGLLPRGVGAGGGDAAPAGARGGLVVQRRLWGKPPSEVVGAESGSASTVLAGGGGNGFGTPSSGQHGPLLALLNGNEPPGALQGARVGPKAADAVAPAVGSGDPEEIERVLRSLRASQMSLVKHVGSLGDALMAVHAAQVASPASSSPTSAPKTPEFRRAGPAWLAPAAAASVFVNVALIGALLVTHLV